MAKLFTDYLMYKHVNGNVYHYKTQPCPYPRHNEITSYALWNGSNINISVKALQPGGFKWVPSNLMAFIVRLEAKGLSLATFEQWLESKNITIETMSHLGTAILDCTEEFVDNENGIGRHLPHEKYRAFIDEVERLDLFDVVDWEGIRNREKINLYDEYRVIHHEGHSYYFKK